MRTQHQHSYAETLRAHNPGAIYLCAGAAQGLNLLLTLG